MWANKFWGPDDVGYTRVIQRMHHAKQTCEEVQHYYKERLQIEADYAKKLASLSRKPLGTNDIGVIKNSFETVRSTTQQSATTHETVARQINEQILQPLEKFSSTMRDRRKQIEDVMAQLTKSKAHQNHITERDRQKYMAECNKISGLQAQQNLLNGKELERNNQKLDKAKFQVETLQRQYQESLKQLASTMETWNTEWHKSLDNFELIETERINFLKSSFWAYTNAISAACVSDDEICETVRTSLEKCDPVADLQLFAENAGTGNQIQDAPEFVNFLKGFSRDSQGTYHVAQFGDEFAKSNDENNNNNSTYNNNSSNMIASKSDVQEISDLGIPDFSATNATVKSASTSPHKKRSWAMPFKRLSNADSNLSTTSLDYAMPITDSPNHSANNSVTAIAQSLGNFSATSIKSAANGRQGGTAYSNANDSFNTSAQVNAYQSPTKSHPYAQLASNSPVCNNSDSHSSLQLGNKSHSAHSLSLDDPLLEALEKLKVSPVKARPKSSYVETKHIGHGYTPSTLSNLSNTSEQLRAAKSTTKRNVHRKQVGSMTFLPDVTSDGQPVIKHAKAIYDYRAAIPEEVSFRKGDVLLVVEMQEDGWWYCQVNGTEKYGLAPHNFLKTL
ncbi:hypothetical protein DASB73_002920 [Starmerella bacillaris]|uniref:Septation protein imp2 n=1 Tax=Starmerella bacillaris TaxID=1247836 RepID=A0AAV5RCX6_STABA|nr:hypothetical protein DASB73_002920 [Starmerella bacillaris]